MNKQKQIEEMAKEIEKAKKHIWASVMPQADDEDYLWHSRAIAEHLMLQGYRKLPEDAVVLTKEEYIDLSRNYVREQIEQTRKGTAKEIDYMFLPIKADKDLVREIEKIQSDFIDKVAESEIKANDEAFTHWQNECENKITIEKRKAVKEFAEKLKEQYVDENLLIDGYFRVIDELLKEYEV